MLAPPEIRIGAELRARVRLLVKRPVRITSLSAEWIGLEEARFGSGHDTARMKYRISAGPLRVLSKTTLEAGEHEYALQMAVPANMPPSYSGQRCSTRHQLSIRLCIPWWFDRETSFELPVEPAASSASHAGEPIVFASREGGPEAKKAYVEGSLASNAMAAGDVLQGAVALLNTEHNRYSKITASLIGTETLHHHRKRERHEARRLSVDIDVKNPGEGESIAVVLRLPETLAPSAQATLWSLQWAFDLVARVRFGRDESIRVPITIAPASQRSEVPLQLVAPRVGSARQRALWEAVAADHGLEYFGAAMMAGSIGEVGLTIERENRGRQGWRLVAKLQYPSLHIGASISEPSLLQGMSFGGMKVVGGKWGRRHVVSARSPMQAQSLFEALAPGLPSFALVRMDDESIYLERPESGLRRRRLANFVIAAREMAEVLSRARTQIPPASEFVESLVQWSEFAVNLGSAIEPGDMSIEGSYQGLTVKTGHIWQRGTLSGTVIGILGLVEQKEEDCFALEPGGDGMIDEEDLQALEGRAREFLGPALLGAVSFKSGPAEDWLQLSPQLEPTHVKTRLAAMARYSSLRANVTGPYR